jgi:hypothetical protein
LSTVFRYFDVRDFVIRVSVNSGKFYSGLCRIIDALPQLGNDYSLDPKSRSYLLKSI